MDKTKPRYTVFHTELGWMGFVSTKQGIYASVLPQMKREEAEKLLLEKLPFLPIFSPESFAPLEAQVRAYFKNGQPEFNCKIDWTWATEFQRKVLEIVCSIPAGRCLTYGQVALLAGSEKGARAVGNALARNNIPVIIPCHRVIGKDNPGGFTGGGLDLKTRLLSLEGYDLY